MKMFHDAARRKLAQNFLFYSFFCCILLADLNQPFPHLSPATQFRLLPLPTRIKSIFRMPHLVAKHEITMSFPLDIDDSAIHAFFMNLALEQARLAASRNEVPVGAVLVLQEKNNSCSSFRMLSTSHNLVETLCDASAHAELLSLRSAAQITGNWRLYNTTLYSTLEPCPMCLSACQAFRVNSIVYGARDLRLGAVESYISLLDESHPYHPTIKVISGVRANECSMLMRDFFRERRKKTGATYSMKYTQLGRLSHWKSIIKKVSLYFRFYR